MSDIYTVFFVQSFSCVQLFATPRTTARQVSLSFTISQSLLKLTSIELEMPSIHRGLCRPLLLLPSIFPSIRVFSNESVLHSGWPKYCSFGFSISPSNEYSLQNFFSCNSQPPLVPSSSELYPVNSAIQNQAPRLLFI